MASDGLHSIEGYPKSIDLRYYAATYSDKRKVSRLIQNQFESKCLDERFFRIKRKCCTLNIDTHFENYRDTTCRNCFQDAVDPSSDGYYANALDINQLFSFRSSMKPTFKYLKLIFLRNDCSVDVSNGVCNNEELLNFIKEYEQIDRENNQSETNQVTHNTLISSVVEACRKFSYSMSSVTLKIIGAVMYVFSWMFMDRLIVSSAEIQNTRKATDQNLPFIYLLKNPSRIDWFIVLITLVFMGFKVPVVFLHKTSMSRSLRWIFRKCGVIFIRPPPPNLFNSDAKRRVCDEAWLIFIEELIREKNHFILCVDTPSAEPDYWLLTPIVDSIRRQAVHDIFVSPVIVNREKDVEQFLPDNWSKKSLFSKAKDICFSRKLNQGFVKVNFIKPFSLKDLVHSSVGKNRNVAELSLEDVHVLMPRIVTHIKYDLCRTHPTMAANLISFLLLKKFRKEVRLSDLVDETDALISELKSRGKRMGFTGSSMAVIKHAISILGPQLIQVENRSGEEYLMPILKVPAVLQMNHYSHHTMMHFMMDAVIFTSISIMFPNEFESAFKDSTELKFKFNELLLIVNRLRDVLQIEYAFEKFCDVFSVELEDALLKLCNDDLLIKEEKLMTEEERWANRFARRLEGLDEDDDSYNDDDEYDFEDRQSPSPTMRVDDDTYVLNLNAEKSIFKRTVFYRNALKPYLDAYLRSAEHLRTLINKQVPGKYYCKTLANQISIMMNENQLTHPETLNMSVLHNTVRLFAEWQIINRYIVDGIEFISLNHEFNTIGALIEVVRRTKILD